MLTVTGKEFPPKGIGYNWLTFMGTVYDCTNILDFLTGV